MYMFIFLLQVLLIVANKIHCHVLMLPISKQCL